MHGRKSILGFGMVRGEFGKLTRMRGELKRVDCSSYDCALIYIVPQSTFDSVQYHSLFEIMLCC